MLLTTSQALLRLTNMIGRSSCRPTDASTRESPSSHGIWEVSNEINKQASASKKTSLQGCQPVLRSSGSSGASNLEGSVLCESSCVVCAPHDKPKSKCCGQLLCLLDPVMCHTFDVPWILRYRVIVVSHLHVVYESDLSRCSSSMRSHPHCAS